MRQLLFILLLVFICLVYSCKNVGLEQYASDWSNQIREKAIQNSEQTPDSVKDQILHDTIHMVVAFKDGQVIKSTNILPNSTDTLVKIYWGRDAIFNFARRSCSFLKGEADEVITHKGQAIGLHKFFYCDGKIKMQGLEYEGRVGVWEMYDTNGIITKKIDYGNVEKLEKLKELKYVE